MIMVYFIKCHGRRNTAAADEFTALQHEYASTVEFTALQLEIRHLWSKLLPYSRNTAAADEFTALQYE
jgi:phage host-nuclease inhibitor protein Gam